MRINWVKILAQYKVGKFLERPYLRKIRSRASSYEEGSETIFLQEIVEDAPTKLKSVKLQKIN